MGVDRDAATGRTYYRLIDLLAVGSTSAATVALWGVIGAWSFLIYGGYLLGGVSFWAFERRDDDGRWF